VVVEGPEAVLLLVDHGEMVEFAGDSDLTDYHSPLGTGLDPLCLELAGALGPGRRLCLDSLTAEGAKLLGASLAGAGLQPEGVEHEVAMVLDLPEAVEDYYAGLAKKERHELRRKRRKYQEEMAPVRLQSGGGGVGIDEFIRLHRLSEGAKGSFMTEERAHFFRRLATQPGWQVDLLEAGDGPSAALFAWVGEGGYYLYNAAYDPRFQAWSPGVVALTAAIEASIEAGLGYFDFLKGGEAYKARLGARPRPLYRIEAGS
jgi:CelD/BcsL family acetyltransferase involved in cellulose biosynthesis